MKIAFFRARAVLLLFCFYGIHPGFLQAAPFRMLPFQGRLTDASGVAIPDGARVVQFKIYDAPSGGTAVWNGEVHKLTVNGGLISTLLGSKAVFTSSVDFNEALYLEITVDADGDGKITAADPPLLPRQSILPSVFAVEAQVARSVEWVDGQGRAQGSANWSALFGPNVDPTMGKINASRLADGSLSNAQIRAGTITADRLVAGTVTASQLGTGAVGTPQIADEAVTSAKIKDGTVVAEDLAGQVDASGVETTPGAVTSAKIRDGTIVAADIQAGAIIPSRMSPDVAVFVEEKSSTEHGGAQTAGWNDRKLNANRGSVGNSISLNASTGIISLKQGVYLVNASCPAYITASHQAALWDVTSSTPQLALLGTSEWADFPNGAGVKTNRSHVLGVLIVPDAIRQYRLRHWTESSSSLSVALGVGNDGSSGGTVSLEKSVFSMILIQRIQ